MDLTKGNPRKLMFLFSVPIFLSQLLQQLYNTADSLIAGRFLGTLDLAAVSSSGNLIYLMTAFIDGTALGAGVAISKYFGAHDENRLSKAVHNNLAFGLIAGAVLTVVGVFFTPTILRWMNTPEDVLPRAVQYFRWYFMGSLPVVLYNVGRGILTAVGDSRRPLYYLMLSSGLNILLDLVLVGLFRFGISAIAVATVVSQSISMLLCMGHLFSRKNQTVEVRISQIRLHRELTGEMLAYGIPGGIQNSVIGISNSIIQSQINLWGSSAMAAFGAHNKIFSYASTLQTFSFTSAIMTFTSQNLGAKQYQRAKEGIRFGIWAAMGLSAFASAIYCIFAPEMLSWFDSNPDVIRYGVMLARTVAPFSFLCAFSYGIAAVFRGSGHPNVSMLTMLIIWCGMRTAFVFYASQVLRNIHLVFASHPISWAVSSLVFAYLYLRIDWIHGLENRTEGN